MDPIPKMEMVTNPEPGKNIGPGFPNRQIKPSQGHNSLRPRRHKALATPAKKVEPCLTLKSPDPTQFPCRVQMKKERQKTRPKQELRTSTKLMTKPNTSM